MNNFKITGPGTYRTRDGKKIKIFRLEHPFMIYNWGSDISSYTDEGYRWIGGEGPDDIVAVWEEASSGWEKLPTLKDYAPELFEYDLTKVSERFRAIEDGQTLTCEGRGAFNKESLEDGSYLIELVHGEGTWSLVPLKRKVKTKLYIYWDINGELSQLRSRLPVNDPDSLSYSKLIGAIEGSELTHEEEV